MANNLYQKVFTGEIPPLIIKEDTPTNKTFVRVSDLSSVAYKEISILRWRDIAKLHIPANAKISSCEFEFKLEYLQIDFWVPSVRVVPSQDLPLYSPVDTDAQTQTKTVELRNKYNRDSGHALEIRLLRCYDPNYQLNRQTPDNYSENTSFDPNLQYPISELLYHNRLPGFYDLMAYLIKNGNLIFADIRQELKLQIIPNLGDKDSIVITGGYTGSVIYEEIEIKYKVETTTSITQNLSTLPTKILEANSNRFSFYICNNSENQVYFSFGTNSPSLALKLTLEPNKMLIYEHGQIYIDGIVQNLIFDGRARMGTPLWARATANNSPVSVEELSFVEV